jgi:hypothetical protein
MKNTTKEKVILKLKTLKVIGQKMPRNRMRLKDVTKAKAKIWRKVDPMKRKLKRNQVSLFIKHSSTNLF